MRKVNSSEFKKIIEEKIRENSGGLRNLANRLGMTARRLNDIKLGNYLPTEQEFKNMTEEFGFKFVLSEYENPKNIKPQKSTSINSGYARRESKGSNDGPELV